MGPPETLIPSRRGRCRAGGNQLWETLYPRGVPRYARCRIYSNQVTSRTVVEQICGVDHTKTDLKATFRSIDPQHPSSTQPSTQPPPGIFCSPYSACSMAQ